MIGFYESKKRKITISIILIAVIYIAFIGLGIPDSLFGTAWPSIYTEFQLPLSYGSFITTIICFGTMISSMLSARIINRLGTNKVTAFSTVITAFALLGLSYSNNFVFLCLCAIPLGLGAGSIDTALNNYVAIHYSARHMNFLHCFYGIGITISPYVLSMAILGGAGWKGGYRIAFFIQMVITVILFLSLPIWNKVNGKEIVSDEENIEVLNLKDIIKIPGVVLMWGQFFLSCGMESICGVWGSTFLVETKHLVPEKAASTIIFYFIGVAVGRLLSGIISSKLSSWKIIIMGQCILGTGIVLILFPGSSILLITGLFFIGVGNGPLFPNLNYLTPELFGEGKSPSIIGTQMTVASISIMVVPVALGFLGQRVGMWLFPLFLLVFFLCLVLTTRKTMKLFK